MSRRIPDDIKALRGTLRPSRIRPTVRYEAGAELTAEQLGLLEVVPDWLPPAEAEVYGHTVSHGPWLQMSDRGLLSIYSVASIQHRRASAALAGLMGDAEAMCDAKSETARAALAYQKIIREADDLLAKCTKVGGFSPAARERLGIVLD